MAGDLRGSFTGVAARLEETPRSHKLVHVTDNISGTLLSQPVLTHVTVFISRVCFRSEDIFSPFYRILCTC